MTKWGCFLGSTTIFLYSQTVLSGTLTHISGLVLNDKILKSQDLGRKESHTILKLMIKLPEKDPKGLEAYARRVKNPKDALYQHFLTRSEFIEKFSPTEEDLNQVVDYMKSRNLTLTHVYPNRTLIELQGSVSQVERVFQTEIHSYRAEDGRIFFSTTSDPIIPSYLSSKIVGILGLNDFSRVIHNGIRKPFGDSLSLLTNYTNTSSSALGLMSSHTSGSGTGSSCADSVSESTSSTDNISDYIIPNKFKSAYNVDNVNYTGSGQVIGLVEFGCYRASDINYYYSHFNLGAGPSLNYVDVGATSAFDAQGGCSSSDDEATLNIELALSLASAATVKVYINSGNRTVSGLTAILNAINSSASPPSVVSISWGISESDVSTNDLNSLNTTINQMAVLGITIVAGSGDTGPYTTDSNGNLSSTRKVYIPASNPNVIAVGGTHLSLNSGTGAYSSETAWSNSLLSLGGGGGISTKYTLPSLQSGLGTTGNLGSTTYRMIPDVSLHADSESGYPIYYTDPSCGIPAWYIYGGTSAAAPLWAAYIAVINQQRLASNNNLGAVGSSMSSKLYSIASNSTAYSVAFHDVNDGSTNLYYPAVGGYDLATGLGSPNGANLLQYFLLPSAPSTLSLTAGYQSVTASWAVSTGALSYTLQRSTSRSGTYTAVATLLTSTSYMDTAVSAGITYYYYVQAVNSNGTSSASVIQSVVPSATLTSPNTPANFTVRVVSQ